MKKNKILLLFAAIALIFSSCNDFLKRENLTSSDDYSYWRSETSVRLFVNSYYTYYFRGYNDGWGVDYAPLRGYDFCDDLASTSTQRSFKVQAPESLGSVSEAAGWQDEYSGPTWCFAWVRKTNLLLDRVASMRESGIFNDEQHKHWTAIGRFFRGVEYSMLASVFGDVPYYDQQIPDTDMDMLYKDRDKRNLVMDKVYDDFKWVLEGSNMRLSDAGNVQNVNRIIAASYISRFMLFEGTWQKYHANDQTRAKKFLEFAVQAADMVINTGSYNFSNSQFRPLFGTIGSLAANREVILFRQYSSALGIMHHVASYSNLTESQAPAPNLDLAKSFICQDGQPYQLSSMTGADKFDVASFVKSRDPRFEATFAPTVRIQSSTLLYACKFIDRLGVTYDATSGGSGTYPPQYGSNTNTNSYPCMRYAEVVLNWIEAKAELATMGGAAVTQADLDKSINAIRSRPLESEAIAKGIKQTAPLQIANIPNDPARDADVPALLWEIRRERRMEFVYEHTRLNDLRRWKKYDYMDYNKYPDKMLGPWVDFPVELPAWLVASRVNVLKVKKADGTIVTYNGSNGADMVGFYIPTNAVNRSPFTDRVYLAPVGRTQISEYKDKGYTLTQTPGW